MTLAGSFRSSGATSVTKTLPQLFKEEFWQGFLFANRITKAINGKPVDGPSMMRLLRELADGSASLEPTPEEFVKSVETDIGPIQADLKEHLRQTHMGEQRRASDAAARARAQEYVAAIDALEQMIKQQRKEPPQ